jgi:hypothetical protein
MNGTTKLNKLILLHLEELTAQEAGATSADDVDKSPTT